MSRGKDWREGGSRGGGDRKGDGIGGVKVKRM